MKRIITAGIIALTVLAVSQQQASANFKFCLSGGFNSTIEWGGCSFNWNYNATQPCSPGSCPPAYAAYSPTYPYCQAYNQGAGFATPAMAAQPAQTQAPATATTPRPAAAYTPAAIYPVRYNPNAAYGYYPNAAYGYGYNTYGYGAGPAYWYGR